MARSAVRCARTGLWLVPSAAQEGVRVAKPSYGALNPPFRHVHGSDVAAWGRFDTYEGRTVYVGDCARTTYCETLAYVAPAVGRLPKKLSDVFDDVDGSDPRGLYDAIAAEWDQLFSMTPEKIVAGWRNAAPVHHHASPRRVAHRR